MPRPKPQRQVLDLPLTSGISQKEDPKWIALGQAVQLQNFSKGKTSTLDKPVGFQSLNPTTTADINITNVVQLASNKTTLLSIGQQQDTESTQYPPGLFSFSAQDYPGLEYGIQQFLDRVPEFYINPVQSFAAYDQTVYDMDQVVVTSPGQTFLIMFGR